MKKFISFSAVLLLLPLLAGAHGGTTPSFEEAQTSPMMMHYIEDQALGDELHEEMEDLMIKMMSGTLTEAEANRLTELMQEYPGPHAMMMSRLGGEASAVGNGWMMHGMRGNASPWLGGFWMFLFALTWLVWLGVGALALVWLWKQVAYPAQRRNDNRDAS